MFIDVLLAEEAVLSDAESVVAREDDEGVFVAAGVFEGLDVCGAAFDVAQAPLSGVALTVRGASNAFLGTVILAAVDRRARRELRR